jgi:K+-sensing histidine kinase KdpD
MRANLKPVIGIAACASAALVLSLFLDGSRDTRLAAPPMCLLVVIVTTIYLGRLAGVLGAAAASCVLAVFLYSPFGSLYVEEHAARTMLNLFLIGALAVALLVQPLPERDTAAKRRARRGSPAKGDPTFP